MEIWSLIGEDHHRLKLSLDAVADEIDRESDQAEKLVREFEHELIVHTEAEEKGFYATLAGFSGFERPATLAIEHGRTLRSMVEELRHAGPKDRPSRLWGVKAALIEHIEEYEHIRAVAQRELQYHVAEHMKHDFESAKDLAEKRLAAPYRQHSNEQSKAAALSDSARGNDHAADLLLRMQQCEKRSALVCQAALDRAEETDHRSLLGEIAEDHLRLADELGEMLSTLSVKPRGTGAMALAGRTRVTLGSFLGEKAVLKTVKSNEERSRRASERLRETERPSPPLSSFLERMIDDEHRHDEKIGAALESYDRHYHHKSLRQYVSSVLRGTPREHHNARQAREL